jgi:hypothetical protein
MAPENAFYFRGKAWLNRGNERAYNLKPRLFK